IPLESEENLIVATCTIVDSCGNEVVCEDSIRVFRPAPPICEVEIISPADSALVCSDSVKVTAVTDISGGTPPISITCEINAVMAEVSDAMFMATIPLESEENLIVATCTIVDSCGNEVVCEDSIRIFRPAAPICEVEIISPDDGAIVCEDSLKVTAFTNISVGSPPLTITCDINGITASVEDSLFMATIPLKSGENQIIATCTIENSCGSTTVCRDSITVFFDDIPPTCSFGQDGSSIKGTFFDEHSGIASIDPVYINNATLTVDPFSPGDRAVNFRADVKNPDGAIGFLIKVRDLCGNTFECDPIFLTLEADRDNRQFAFTFPNLDRYLQLSNYGLTEIRVDLNGQKFTLTSDPGRTQSEVNTYFVATDGTITIDLVDYLHEGENNMSIVYEGQSGTRAELFLLDSAQDVDFVLELQSLPVEFQLAQNYPNPFNPTTKIRFDIPEKITDGVQVQLRIYNLLGKLVRVLVDEHKFPGQYLAEWDARDETDAVVSSGIYIYQLTAGEFRKTRRMLLLK
ncbi:MAG: T9SS type A sorting domain-containing protein, partial [bacterium]